MPQQVPQSMSTAEGWMAGAPGDVPLDSLGPSEPTLTNGPAANAPQPAVTPAAQPAAPAPRGPIISTATGTVYNNIDDAVRGTEEKDRLILRMRQDIAQIRGVDPLSGQPVAQQQVADRRRRVMEQSLAGLGGSDADRYYESVAQIVDDRINAVLAPLVPAFSNSVKQATISSLARARPSVASFVGSPDYASTLAAKPLLRASIEKAETDPAAAPLLAELYETSYQVWQGARSQEPGQVTPTVPQGAGAQTTATQVPQTQTLSGTALPPPIFNQPQRSVDYANNAVARRERIEELKRSGIADAPWSSLGLG